MSPGDYWHGSPQLTKAYAEAYHIQKKERNFELWLQGLYFYRALSATLSHILGDEPVEYYSEPLDLDKTEEEYEAERLQEEAEQLEKTLNAFAERVNNERNS